MPRTLNLRVRRGTAAQWAAAGPTLDTGELGLITDTGQLKAGDGVTVWSGLPTISGDRYRPTYAPATLLNNWEAEKSSYNGNARTLRKPRARMKRAMTPAQLLPFHWVFPGDSTGVGYNGATYQYDYCIPRQAGKALARFLGIEHTNGLQTAVATLGALDDTVTVSGSGWTAAVQSYPHFFTGVGVGYWERTFQDPSTSIEFYVSNLSMAGMTYQVDGGTAVAITPTGASTLQKITAGTGLTKGIHTLRINGATAGNYYFVMATRCWDPLVPQVQTHNLCIGGSRANDSANPNYNWSDTTTTAGGASLGYVMINQVLALSGVAADMLTIMAGNNDHSIGTAVSTIITGLTTMRGFAPNAQAQLVRPPMVASAPAATFPSFVAATLTLADTLDCLAFDWNDYEQGQTNYAADGLAGPDGNHPINGVQIAIGRALVDCLNPPRSTPIGVMPDGYGPPANAIQLPANALSTGNQTAQTSGKTSFWPIDVGPTARSIKALATSVGTLQVGGTATLVKGGLYLDDGTGGGPLLTPAGLIGQVTFNALAAGGVAGATRLAALALNLPPGRYWVAGFYYQGSTPPSPVPLLLTATNATTLWALSTGTLGATRYLYTTGTTDLPVARQAINPLGDSQGILVGLQYA